MGKMLEVVLVIAVVCGMIGAFASVDDHGAPLREVMIGISCLVMVIAVVGLRLGVAIDALATKTCKVEVAAKNE